MKKFSKVLGIATCAVALGALVSCTEVNEPYYIPGTPTGNNGSILVKDPKVVAWSGKETFNLNGTTTRADELEAATPVTQDEIAAAKAYFNFWDDNYQPGSGGEDVAELADLNWENYYVQDVVNTNFFTKSLYGTTVNNDETVSNIAFWSLDPDDVLRLLDSESYNENEAKVLYESDGQLVTGLRVRDISFETAGTDDVKTKYEGVRSCGHKGSYAWNPNYKIAKLNGYDDAVYVALYGYTNDNNGFWDRIIKISKVEIPEETPEEPEVTPNIPQGDSVEGNIVHNNEVEVNLAILDTHENYDVEDLVSKLSIHVRYAKDVKVRIPVPTELIVPKDDLDILLTRPEIVYGKENHAAFFVGGNLVELYVNFLDAVDCAGAPYDAGFYEYGCTMIEVSTKGINKDVMEYCFNKNGDGVNFEVYNYYQFNTVGADGQLERRKPTAQEIYDLKVGSFDSSTIEFGYNRGDNWTAYYNITDYPYYYINAFYMGEGDRENFDDVNDCYVKIIDNQGEDFDNVYEGEHLNASGRNFVYVRNDIWGTDKQDDAHKWRDPLPSY